MTEEQEKKVEELLTQSGITPRPEWVFLFSKNKARVITMEVERLIREFGIREMHYSAGLQAADLTGENRLSSSFLRSFGKEGKKKIKVGKEFLKDLLHGRTIEHGEEKERGYYILECAGIILGRAWVSGKKVRMEGVKENK